MTRVQQLDEDDWDKLKPVLRYLKVTHSLKLTLSVDDMLVVKWEGGACPMPLIRTVKVTQ